MAQPFTRVARPRIKIQSGFEQSISPHFPGLRRYGHTSNEIFTAFRFCSSFVQQLLRLSRYFRRDTRLGPYLFSQSVHIRAGKRKRSGKNPRQYETTAAQILAFNQVAALKAKKRTTSAIYKTFGSSAFGAMRQCLAVSRLRITSREILENKGNSRRRGPLPLSLKGFIYRLKMTSVAPSPWNARPKDGRKSA